jgi:hypothetical protein
MTYDELFANIQAYTENTFPDTYLADGSVVSSTTQINTFIKQAEQRIYNTVQFPSLRKNVVGTATVNNKYVSCPEDFLAAYSMAVVTDVTGGDVNTGTYEYLLNKDVNFIRQAYPSPNDTGTPKYYALFGPTVSTSSISNELSFILGPTPDSSYKVELHYYYYPASIIRAQINSLGTITGGSGYINGTYFGVPLTGGTGTGAAATVVVAAGVVSLVTITDPGCQYVVGDVLSATAVSLGGATAGSGLAIPVAAVTNSSGTSWLGDNFDTVLLYGSLVEGYIFMKGEPDIIAGYEAKYKEAMAMAKRLGDGLERGDAYRDGQTKLRVTT